MATVRVSHLPGTVMYIQQMVKRSCYSHYWQSGIIMLTVSSGEIEEKYRQQNNTDNRNTLTAIHNEWIMKETKKEACERKHNKLDMEVYVRSFLCCYLKTCRYH
jgi:hypothetical protein